MTEKVWSMARAGGAPRALLTLRGPASIAVDDSSVYVAQVFDMVKDLRARCDVPILTMVKAYCDRDDGLKPISELLGR
jgi:hypothetical protein